MCMWGGVPGILEGVVYKVYGEDPLLQNVFLLYLVSDIVHQQFLPVQPFKPVDRRSRTI